MTAQLVVGESNKLDGVYVAHWEVPRFEFSVKRWLGHRVERCSLETRDGLDTLSVVLFGSESPPDNWRHSPGKRFAMSFTGTVIERGHFGHKGWCRWRVRVDQWHSVAELPADGRFPAARVLQ